MGASRLPGKVLKDIEGQPMLARVYERAQRARTLRQAQGLLAVATSVDPSDDPVADFCAGRGYPYFRGSMHDVLDRYYQAARFYDAEVIVRITADCPVIDPAVVDETVKLVTENRSLKTDFACNRLPPPFTRTFPIGLDVEVCTFAALERAWKEADQKFQREHVMPYFYEDVQLSAISDQLQAGMSPRGFRVAQLHTRPDYGSLRWTVDTPEDLEFIRQLYKRFDGRDDFTWQEILELVQREPGLSQINAGIRHKTLTETDSRNTDY